ncbi:hypothetical protein CONCODRAFT_11137 [Conidiobolus coronatus NRRL 28638]|uniref:F-box domain-containing protein n=1 Tax=Conidiobolus coronatus (strain ATCC 28846 / CBS 209.66 / NRRL 28638) TaxID=796925 RepID=A0A137NVV8_CONC2|nr:hypothetical protein CONCODRAFT_11137 [Conidiobolus coronatus NRRL 28638]|eukprot:KXN66912.1 hypothetical protein CONCODRAFT_11137 [Conidiobolus coronatus NRRL 28638]
MSCNNFTDSIKPVIETNNWEFLPDVINDLSNYLPHSDLIELSLVCRNYRAQLRKPIFKTLILFMHPVKTLNEYSDIPGRRNKFNRIIEEMKKFSKDNPSVVKEIYICSNLPQYFIRELLDTFKNIECFTIMELKCPMVPILNKPNNLSRLRLEIFFNVDVDKSIVDSLLKFCKKMKFLEIYAFWDYRSRSPPFFQINSTFTNLTTLVVYNPKIEY